MGKKRSQKDRAYITAKEHKEEWGGYKDKSVSPVVVPWRRTNTAAVLSKAAFRCRPLARPPAHRLPPLTTHNPPNPQRAPFARLPFNCCAINFTPFEDPVCTDDGVVYDIVAVVPYVRKFGRHPVKGTPLALSDLIHLNFHKNSGARACVLLLLLLLSPL